MLQEQVITPEPAPNDDGSERAAKARFDYFTKHLTEEFSRTYGEEEAKTMVNRIVAHLTGYVTLTEEELTLNPFVVDLQDAWEEVEKRTVHD